MSPLSDIPTRYSLLAHDAGRNPTPFGGTDPHTELIKRDEAHPLFVKDVLSRDVGSDVPSDRVPNILSSVRVELTTRISVGDVDPRPVPQPVDLDVGVGLYEMSRVDGPIGDQPGPVSRLGTVSDDDGLDVPDDAVWAGLGGSKDAKVVDRVEGEETRVRGLVDGRTGFGDLGRL